VEHVPLPVKLMQGANDKRCNGGFPEMTHAPPEVEISLHASIHLDVSIGLRQSPEVFPPAIQIGIRK
jgi:hypothetical protein